MAVVNPTISYVKGDPNLMKFVWELTTADHTGTAFEYANYADITWHATGTFGGATAAVQGSNTDVDADYGSVKSGAGGLAITFTAVADAPAVSLERPQFMRPKLTTAGTGATVTVSAVARRSTK